MRTELHAPNRNCQVCDTAYYFCNCGHNKDKYHWKMNACTPQHAQIFFVALDLRDGKIDAKAAKAQLKQVGFNKDDLAWCTEAIAGILSPIYEQKKATEQKEEDVEEDE